jgi:hypothetical protein
MYYDHHHVQKTSNQKSQIVIIRLLSSFSAIFFNCIAHSCTVVSQNLLYITLCFSFMPFLRKDHLVCGRFISTQGVVLGAELNV